MYTNTQFATTAHVHEHYVAKCDDAAHAHGVPSDNVYGYTINKTNHIATHRTIANNTTSIYTADHTDGNYNANTHTSTNTPTDTGDHAISNFSAIDHDEHTAKYLASYMFDIDDYASDTDNDMYKVYTSFRDSKSVDYGYYI